MKNITQDFDSASKVMAICEVMQAVEIVRAQDRALIDIMFNGRRPYTDDEVKKHQIRINVNWNEGTKILQDANRQVNNATLYTGKFCNVACNWGPVEKRQEWSQKFTTHFNRLLKRGKCGKKHMNLRKDRNASVCLHGIGPLMWMKADDLLPRFIPLEDMLIPTDTALDLSNLSHFACNLYLTQGEFFDLAHGDNKIKGWNTPLVDAILESLKTPTDNNTYDLLREPEKWQENFKQNHCYYNSDRVPRVKLRAFFFMSPNDKKWYRRIVMREVPTKIEIDSATRDEFVFSSDIPFAEDIDHILHVQYGDCSLVAPLKYHSVRGLGTMLYSPVECNNRLRCQLVQHTLDNLSPLLRIQNPNDRARQQIVNLFPYGVVEDGVSFVPQAERHQVDPNLVEFAMSQMRQIMSESSASYVQDINDGTSKEMTAFEAQARLQSVNVAVGGMLEGMYVQDVPYFEELIRRLLMRLPTDESIIEFRKACKDDGIPDQAMKVENWTVEMERVLGAGDNMLAQNEATALLSQSQRFDPTSQRKILKTWTSTITRNPDLANDLVPMKKPEATDGTQEAEDVFATLMLGVPVSMREGIDQNGYVESMIGMMAAKVGQFNQMEQFGKLPTAGDLFGLQTVAANIQEHVAIIAQNKEQMPNVKQYMDLLGRLENEIKKLTQHVAESEQANKPDDGEMLQAQAKAQATMLTTQSKIAASKMSAEQKMMMKQAQFEQKMAQDLEKHQLALTKQLQQAKAEIAGGVAKTGAEIMNATAKAKAAPKESQE